MYKQKPISKAILLGCCLLTTCLQAQLVIHWDIGLGGIIWEECNSVRPTPDGGFILGGLSSSPVSGDLSQPNRGIFDYWLVKLDSTGSVSWERRYGGNRGDRLWIAEPTFDGGYILGGHSPSDAGNEKSDSCRGSEDFWVIKTDSLGEIEWDRTYGGDSLDILFTLKPLPEGGYLIGGNSSSGISGEKSDSCRGGLDWWIIRTDDQGEILWDITLGGNDNDRLNAIELADDGGFYLAGGARSDISGDISLPLVGVRDFFFAKIDADGELIWQRRYGGTNEDEINCFQKTLDGGFILGGGTRSGISGDKTSPARGFVDFWVLKTDADGNIEWDRTFGTQGLENLYSLRQNSVGYYLLGGFSPSDPEFDKTEPSRGGYDFWMIYLDPQGNKLWDKTFGGPDNDVLTSLIQNEDGSYILAGHSSSGQGGDKKSPNKGMNDMWLIRTGCDLEIDLGPDTTLCLGDSLLLQPSITNCDSCRYRWENNLSTRDRLIDPSEAKTYKLFIYDIRGCLASDEITVYVQDLPQIALPPDTTACADSGLTLDAGPEDHLFYWSTGDTSRQIQPDSSGLFSLTLTDSLGCQSRDSSLVELLALPFPSDTLFQCSPLNDSYQVSFSITDGVPGSYEVSGTPGLLLGDLFTSDDLPNGSAFSFALSDANDCGPTLFAGDYKCPCLTESGSLIQEPIEVCGPGPATAVHLGDQSLDNNDALQFVLHNGSADSIGQVFSQEDEPVFFLQTGMEYGQTYYIAAVAGWSDSTGYVNPGDSCFSMSTGVPVTFFEIPEAVIQPMDPLLLNCYTPSFFLDGTLSAPAPLMYQWYKDGIPFGGSSSLLEVDLPGDYALEVTTTDGGCRDTSWVSIESDQLAPEIQIDPPPLFTCRDTLLSLDASSSDQAFYISYQWQGGGILGPDSLPLLTVNEPGLYSLRLINHQNGCADSLSVQLTADTIPPGIGFLPPDTLDCITAELRLSVQLSPADRNYAYSWSTAEGSFSSPPDSTTAWANAPGLYYFDAYQLENGCTSVDSIRIIEDVDDPEGFLLDLQPPSCFGEKNGRIEILGMEGGHPPFRYRLEEDGFWQEQGVFPGLGAGIHQIQLKDARGCRLDTSLLLEQPGELQLSLGKDLELELGDSAIVQAQINIPWEEVYRLEWTPAPASPCETPGCIRLGLLPFETTRVRAELTDKNGCRAEDQLTIFLRRDRDVYIPNAFSPNGDGRNDHFRIFGGQSVVRLRTLCIFDRWGNFVFEARDLPPAFPAAWWDGRFRGSPLPPGSYAYFVELEFIDGESRIYEGSITLIR